MMIARIFLLLLVLTFAAEEDFEEVAVGGYTGFADITNQNIALWNSAVTRYENSNSKIESYQSEDLLALEDPVQVRTQVVAGTNYEFIFNNNAKITVWEQIWTNKLEITSIDIPKKSSESNSNSNSNSSSSEDSSSSSSSSSSSDSNSTSEEEEEEEKDDKDGNFAGGCSSNDVHVMQEAGAGDGAGSFPKIIADCSKSSFSIFTGIDKDALVKCVDKQIPLSAACTMCFANAAQYGVKNCKLPCIASWCSSDCLTCNTGASAELDTCTGLAKNQVPQPAPCDSEAEVRLGNIRGGVSGTEKVDEESLAIWNQVLEKEERDNTKLFFVNLGAPVTVQTQVVSGKNYIFTFSDHTKITVFSQPWTQTLKVTSVNAHAAKVSSDNNSATAHARRSLIDTQAGGWGDVQDLTEDDKNVWQSIVNVSEEEYNGKTLAALGIPMKISKQVVAGINYEFYFQDGTKIEVFVQSWTNTIQISTVDGEKAVATTIQNVEPTIMMAGGRTNFRPVEDSDLKVWEMAKDKSHTEFNHVVLSTLGDPVEVSTQVVGGVNYLFKFSDGTVIQIFEQSWMDVLEISQVNYVVAQETCPGNQIIMNCKPACPNICGQRPGLCMAMLCKRGCTCANGLWQKEDNCVKLSQCEDEKPRQAILLDFDNKPITDPWHHEKPVKREYYAKKIEVVDE